MKTIVAYPGRFQPFGPHHFKNYEWLCSAFGKANVYICTSNRTDTNSPLNFEEKRQAILKYNVLPENVIETKEPYKPIELLQRFNQKTTSLIVAVGEKDNGRIPLTKKDGSPTWFREYYGQRDLVPVSQGGYVIELPHIKIPAYMGSTEELSGTFLRRTLPLVTQREFAAIMGYYDPNLQYLFKKRFHPDITEAFGMSPNFDNKAQNQTYGFSRHILHPYEDNATWDDLGAFISDVCSGKTQGSIKRDGYNLQVTYSGGKFKAARNKTTAASPLSIEELIDKYTHKPLVQRVFADAMTAISDMCEGMPANELNKIFGSGRTFVNFEILDPKNATVLKCTEPEIYLHSMITYDSTGNEMSRDTNIPFDTNRYSGKNYKVKVSKLYDIRPVSGQEIEEEFLSELRRLQSAANCKYISDAPFDVKNMLRRLILKFGSIIIYEFCKKNVQDWSNKNTILNIISGIDYDSLPETQRQKYDDSMVTFSKIGGANKLSPIEGLVVPWNNKMYKLTGAFGALVPILIDIYNKNRTTYE